MEFLKLERDVLELFARENAQRYPQLIRQIAGANVSSREHTGYGVLTHIGLPPDLPHIIREVPLFFIALVCVELERGRGLGFALFIKDGLLKTLEGFPYENKWPSEIGEYRLSYLRSTGEIIEADEHTNKVH